MKFKIWLEAAEEQSGLSDNPQLWFFKEPGYIALFRGTPNDERSSDHLGFIHFNHPRPDTIHVHYVKVYWGNRRQGIAKMLYQELLKTLKQDFPGVRYITADATSQRALSVHNKAFGQPIGTYIKGKKATPEQIIAYLPRNSPENDPDHGVADLSRDTYVRVRHRLS